ncbi:hypothetical protein A2307_03795 [Candidatus Peregrinibacteria bacterium RIFOXYB2_FULL_33_20]|nr:MAG: hypothetical protein A2263_02655 [Candidatus Peregrinibacteria bacterium RIFOXYA2_FULL_33_21]OGJ50365.1 MAG: hypothetical protein A2307_03795 [Candidatus Peregrinibacteria bacterium RIFOXYB2_FULL_33_20]
MRDPEVTQRTVVPLQSPLIIGEDQNSEEISFKTSRGRGYLYSSSGARGKVNEDRVVEGEDGEGNLVVAVIDGMSGETNGALAAQLLAEEVARQQVTEIAVLNTANEYGRRQDKSGDKNEYIGNGGACLVSCRICIQKIRNILKLGDCRMFVINRYGRIKFRTDDGGPAIDSVRRTTIPYDEVFAHRRRNEVSDVVSKDLTLVNIADPKNNYEDIVFEAGDTVILLSDGFSDLWTDEQIVDMIAGKSPEEASDVLDTAYYGAHRGGNSLWNLRQVPHRDSEGQIKADNISSLVFVNGLDCVIADSYKQDLLALEKRERGYCQRTRRKFQNEAEVKADGSLVRQFTPGRGETPGAWWPKSGYRFVDPSLVNWAVERDIASYEEVKGSDLANFTGQGLYKYTVGEGDDIRYYWYIGGFKKGKRDGIGTIICANDDSQIIAQFDKDEQIETFYEQKGGKITRPGREKPVRAVDSKSAGRKTETQSTIRKHLAMALVSGGLLLGGAGLAGHECMNDGSGSVPVSQPQKVPSEPTYMDAYTALEDAVQSQNKLALANAVKQARQVQARFNPRDPEYQVLNDLIERAK